jgi:hypothetical protein
MFTVRTAMWDQPGVLSQAIGVLTGSLVKSPTMKASTWSRPSLDRRRFIAPNSVLSRPCHIMTEMKAGMAQGRMKMVR